MSLFANCRSQCLLDRLGRCIKLFVSTDSRSCLTNMIMCTILCSSQVNTFQVVLVTDGVDHYVIYNYGDVQWVDLSAPYAMVR